MRKDLGLRKFGCWKCNTTLFRFRLPVFIIIYCPKCGVENRAGVGKPINELKEIEEKAECTTSEKT